MKHFLLILLLALLAIFVHGYQFGVSDQEISIPIILKSQNYSLFENDLLLSQNFAKSSISYQAQGFLTKYADIQTIFFIGYILFQSIFFAVIYRLAKILLEDSRLAYLSLLTFFLPKFIGGTANFTYDLYFGHREIGLIFLIFFLIYLLEKKFIKAAIVSSIGIWFHPLSIIPSLILLPVIVMANRKRTNFLKIAIVSGILLLPYVLFSKSDLPLLPYFQDLQWLSILKLRADYLFPSLWSQRAWLSLGLFLSIIFIFVTSLKKETKKMMLLITFGSLLIFIMNFIILEIIKVPPLGQYQLVRSIFPLAYLGLLLSPLLLTGKNLVLKIVGTIAFIALSLNLYTIFFVSLITFLTVKMLTKSETATTTSSNISLAVFLTFFFLHFLTNMNSYKDIQEKVQFPKKTNDWINLQLWALNNTSKGDIFLVPPQKTGFRIFSLRPIVGDIKDGAAAIYSRQYSIYWAKLITDTANYQNFTKSDFEKLGNIYKFNYFVTAKDKTNDTEIIYENSSFAIHKL